MHPLLIRRCNARWLLCASAARVADGAVRGYNLYNVYLVDAHHRSHDFRPFASINKRVQGSACSAAHAVRCCVGACGRAGADGHSRHGGAHRRPRWLTRAPWGTTGRPRGDDTPSPPAPHTLTHSLTHTHTHSHRLSHRPPLRARSASLVRSAALAVYRARSMPVDGSKCSLCAAAGDARGGPRRILDGKGPARGEGASPHLGIDELLLRGALEALRPSTLGFAHSPARARCHC